MLAQLLKFEIKKHFRQIQDVLYNLVFFILTATIFVFAVTPNFSQQAIYASGIVLSIMILSILVGVEKTFREDYQDGVLEQIMIFDRSASKVLLAKFLGFLISGPCLLLLVSPLILSSYGLAFLQIKAFIYISLLMLPSICAICFLSSVLTFKLLGKSCLVFLIALPLLVPEIIFIMLTLNNYYTNSDWQIVSNYLEYMLYVNFLILPLCYYLGVKAFKAVMRS